MGQHPRAEMPGCGRPKGLRSQVRPGKNMESTLFFYSINEATTHQLPEEKCVPTKRRIQWQLPSETHVYTMLRPDHHTRLARQVLHEENIQGLLVLL